MTKPSVAATLVVLASVAHAAPATAPLTTKHVDAKGDPNKDSDAAPKDMWWVSCYINVAEKGNRLGAHTLYFGPWLAARSGGDVEDAQKFAEQLYTAYEPAIGAEFPKYEYLKGPYPQRACIANPNASNSERYWKSRDIGTAHASRSKFVPAFAK